jgi:hypothetical protein
MNDPRVHQTVAVDAFQASGHVGEGDQPVPAAG